MNIKPIKNEADYDAALAAIGSLMDAEPDTRRKARSSMFS